METLPPINQKPQGIAANESKLVNKAKERGRRATRFLTWEEQQARRKEHIRAEIPVFSRVDIRTYRNTFKHNLCIDMLKDGFHKSFSELYSLIENRRKQRIDAGPNSSLWLEASLDEQHEKLEELAKYLMKAESMQRNSKWKDVYECRVRLAEYFLTSGDKWLSDHFFNSALDTSRNIRLDGRRREAEAHCNRALALERSGQITEAVFHMRAFQEIATGNKWRDEDDVLLSSIACRHLCRVYTTFADDSTDIEQQLRLLHQAYTVASEGENEHLQKAKCGLNLARKYEESGESEIAIKFLNECLEIAQDIGDAPLCGEACKAMAVSLQSLGDIKRSLDFFEMYAENAKQAELTTQVVSASCCLGQVSITQGEYDKSVEHCEAAYKLTSSKLTEKSIPAATDNATSSTNDEAEHPDVLLGIARGMEITSQYDDILQRTHPQMINRILLWKNERVDDLEGFADYKDGEASVFSLVLDSLQVDDSTSPYSDDDNTEAATTTSTKQQVSTDRPTSAVSNKSAANMSGRSSRAAFAIRSSRSMFETTTDNTTTTDTSYEMPPETSDETSGDKQKS